MEGKVKIVKVVTGILILAGLLLAQGETINLTVTISAEDAKLLEAYRQTQCETKDAVGACLSYKWATVKDMLVAAVSEALTGKFEAATTWAIDAKSAALPEALGKAASSLDTAKTGVEAAKKALGDARKGGVVSSEVKPK